MHTHIYTCTYTQCVYTASCDRYLSTCIFWTIIVYAPPPFPPHTSTCTYTQWQTHTARIKYTKLPVSSVTESYEVYTYIVHTRLLVLLIIHIYIYLVPSLLLSFLASGTCSLSSVPSSMVVNVAERTVPTNYYAVEWLHVWVLVYASNIPIKASFDVIINIPRSSYSSVFAAQWACYH